MRSRDAQILLGTFSLGFLGKLSVLHTGVLTKMFAMSVLYLKTVLNYGLVAINGEDVSKAGSHGSQMGSLPDEPARRIARTLPGEPPHWSTARTPPV